MAIFYPPAPRGTEPDSELAVRNRLAALDDTWRVFCSVAWQSVRGGRQGDGEADFVLLHRRHGVLVIEVKGGGVRVEGGQWRTVDRYGVAHAIKDPFRQATDSKHALVKFLNSLVPALHPVPRICHAVCFNDTTVLEPIGTQPRELVIDASDLLNAPGSIERIIRHWGQWNACDLGPVQLDRVTQVLAPTTSLRRRLQTDVAQAEQEIIQLTRQQVRALRALRNARRCVIRGNAGTGKTLLAIEKARQVAREGGRVLLTCFNGPLAEHTARECADAPAITVATFHQLALAGARSLRRPVPSIPSSEWWDQEAATLLADSAEAGPARFDALIVDEAQDFSDAWLTALQLLLVDPDSSLVYLFLDSHQQLYNRALAVPDWFPFELDTNCRNTLPIARRVASVFGDPPPAEGADGHKPAFVELPRPSDAPSLVQEVVDRLVCEEGLRPSQIVVLAEERSTVEALRQLVSAGGCFAGLGEHGVVAETIHRFKGLEAEVVVLVLSGAPSSEELIYVGMSRARSMLVVVGAKSVRNRFDLR